MLKPKINQFGEKGLLLRWPDKINEEIHQNVLAYQNWIENKQIHLIQETNIGYQSLLIILKNEVDIQKLVLVLEKINENDLTQTKDRSYTYTIPVCYDSSFGLDIEMIAKQKNISVDEVIKLHTSQSYKIYFTGFLPGFLYLGGLSHELNAPRLSKPRLDVPKGSVGIGGKQTGIYPQNSPGGWNIIGKTPILLFDKSKEQPVLCKPGDIIQFESISFEEYTEIKYKIQTGKYSIRKEAKND